jgi:hypothetical protein
LVVTNTDGATKNTVEDVFPDVSTILCTWYINKYVSARYIKTVDNKGQKEFITA